MKGEDRKKTLKPLGKILDVDLTGKTIEETDFSEDLVQKCLGGFGLNTHLLYKGIGKNTDPLGPDNLLVLSTGLLTGTAAPSSSRIHVNARSPLSGLIGSSNVGGFLGVRLRSLNIRSIVIRGRAKTPVYLHLSEAGARLADATSLWGLDTRETESRLKSDIGDDKTEVMTIGPAGENRVRYACIMAGMDHAAGHTGMGAVMGAKNLKAVCVQGTKQREKPSPKTAALVKEYIQSIKNSVSRYRDFSDLGSSGDILELNEMGLLGFRNYRTMQVEDAVRIDGSHLKSYVTRKTSCHRCPVHCKAEIEIKEGKYKGFKGGRPEYETIINMGALCGLTDPKALLYLSNLCNILGLDTISTGSVMAFAIDLFDRGIITTKETEGLELTWGNADAMEVLMRRIALRQGFGDLLAEGVRRAAEAIGRGAEKYAYHVKDVEMYGGDPRGMMGTALSYAVSLRGGDFTSVYPIPEFRYTPEQARKEFGTRKAVEYTATQGKGALVRHCMIVSAVIDSLGICKVPALSIATHFDLSQEAALVEALTGFSLSPLDLFRIGERIINMEKLFNLRCGASAALDTLPEKFIGERIAEGPSKGTKADIAPMIQDFYRIMGWDETGVPLTATLKGLGLPFDSDDDG